MFILFSLIVMRMSGAIALNPIFGRNNFPSSAKAAFVFVCSLMLYAGMGQAPEREPASLIEYGVMLASELLFGFILGFGMELCVLVVRFASSVMDYMMGLNMAQIYDPQYNSQMTITSGMYYAFLMLLFFAVDGHLKLFGIFFAAARFIPFGSVSIRPELSEAVLKIFQDSILMGLQYAMPLIAMELVAEVAVGIIMRMIPHINVFVINFQMKIIVGILMLMFLFSPMSDKLNMIIDTMFRSLWRLALMMR